MNIVALKAAKNDLVADVFAKILGDWSEVPGLRTWKMNLEVAYHFSKRQGTTIGLFSNLPGKLGLTPSEEPFFQVQAERLPFKLQNVEGWRVNFGLNEYFQERYSDCAALLVPFLTYASILYRSRHNQLWNVEVGNWRKGEPLVVTFATPKTMLKLALFGHVIIRDADLIETHTPKPMVLSVPEFDEAGLRVFAAYSDERLIHELMANKRGKPVFLGALNSDQVIGTYDEVRLEHGVITMDVRLIDPKEFDGLDVRVAIVPRLGYDTKRSGRKYTKRYITPHTELEVRLLTTDRKD